jgi:hypothetical protein
MSQGGDTFGPNPYSSPDGGPPPKRGMSTAVKVLLILGGVFVVLALVCCGFGIWIFNKLAPTTDPAKVLAIQQSMATIDVPEHLTPQFGMDMSFQQVKMKMAMFAAHGGGEMLMLMQMAGAEGDASAQEQMERELRKQGKQQNMTVNSSQSRKVKTADGQEVDFEFSKGTQDGRAMRQVRGVFQGRDGAVMLQYIVAEEEWDEEATLEMLQSIRK